MAALGWCSGVSKVGSMGPRDGLFPVGGSVPGRVDPFRTGFAASPNWSIQCLVNAVYCLTMTDITCAGALPSSLGAQPVIRRAVELIRHPVGLAERGHQECARCSFRALPVGSVSGLSGPSETGSSSPVLTSGSPSVSPVLSLCARLAPDPASSWKLTSSCVNDPSFCRDSRAGSYRAMSPRWKLGSRTSTRGSGAPGNVAGNSAGNVTRALWGRWSCVSPRVASSALSPWRDGGFGHSRGSGARLSEWIRSHPAGCRCRTSFAARSRHASFPRLLGELINERRREPVEPGDFLRARIEARYGGGVGVPDGVLINLVPLIGVAGYETVTGHISGAIIGLHRHPEKLHKVIDYAHDVLDEVDVDELALKSAVKVQFLDRALHETERMHPVAFMVIRAAVETVEYKVCATPEGERLMISASVARCPRELCSPAPRIHSGTLRGEPEGNQVSARFRWWYASVSRCAFRVHGDDHRSGAPAGGILIRTGRQGSATDSGCAHQVTGVSVPSALHVEGACRCDCLIGHPTERRNGRRGCIVHRMVNASLHAEREQVNW